VAARRSPSLRIFVTGDDPIKTGFVANLSQRRLYRTRDEAKADVFDYIERFYNPKRRHSTIGYLSPIEFERFCSAFGARPERPRARRAAEQRDELAAL
jgi:transposase InsO family protein